MIKLDIIQIDAPNNEILNNKTFLVTYISSQKIKVTNTDTLEDSSLLIIPTENIITGILKIITIRLPNK